MQSTEQLTSSGSRVFAVLLYLSFLSFHSFTHSFTCIFGHFNTLFILPRLLSVSYSSSLNFLHVPHFGVLQNVP